jgi:hypothetical protein
VQVNKFVRAKSMLKLLDPSLTSSLLRIPMTFHRMPFYETGPKIILPQCRPRTEMTDELSWWAKLLNPSLHQLALDDRQTLPAALWHNG